MASALTTVEESRAKHGHLGTLHTLFLAQLLYHLSREEPMVGANIFPY